MTTNTQEGLSADTRHVKERFDVVCGSRLSRDNVLKKAAGKSRPDELIFEPVTILNAFGNTREKLEYSIPAKI